MMKLGLSGLRGPTCHPSRGARASLPRRTFLITMNLRAYPPPLTSGQRPPLQTWASKLSFGIGRAARAETQPSRREVRAARAGHIAWARLRRKAFVSGRGKNT